MPAMKPVLAGERFHELVVLRVGDGHRKSSGGVERTVVCRCDCGTVGDFVLSRLRSGETKSCGCRKSRVTIARNTKHGLAGTREYAIWTKMMTRCYSPGAPEYKHYGGRGIVVCARWHDVRAFVEDMSPFPPSRVRSLDRIDNDGPYSPENCRWATQSEQCRNQRRNHRITFNGKTQTMLDWTEELGIPYDRVERRINKLKWTPEKALTTP